jgi:HSP20 family protein
MKNRHKKYVIGFCSVLALAGIMYPIYAADKDDGKCCITDDSGGGGVSKQVVAQDDNDAFGGCYGSQEWDPFAEFVRMQQEMNNLLNGTFSPYRSSARADDDSWVEAVAAPACDIKESAGKYLVTLDLPGIEKSDIKIKLDGSILTVSGKRSSSVEKKDGDRIILQERSQGSFRRSIRLSHRIKKDGVEASYKNGILTITVPQEEPVDNSIDVPIK